MIRRALVMSVGGSPEPILASIRSHDPGFVLFVVSQQSRYVVENTVLANLHSLQYEYRQVSDHEDIGNSYKEIREGIRTWIDGRQLDTEQVCADITGGTKAMSGALALVSAEFGIRQISYVGGSKRDSDNLGAVRSGSEVILDSPNPYREYAVRSLERANWLINNFYADPAAEVLMRAKEHCGSKFKNCLVAFAGLATALGHADRFQFKHAVTALQREFARLEYTLDSSLFESVFKDGSSLRKHWTNTRHEVSSDGQTPGKRTLLELLANSERRATQARYDDAVGRIYRAIELRGQQLVKEAFGCELGRVRLDDFPTGRRQEVIEFFGVPESHTYILPLKKLYRSLSFCEDSLLREQGSIYDRLQNHLTHRNQSLLAHGVQPVSKDRFEGLWRVTLDSLDIGKEDIPRWPRIILRLPTD